uniref:Uncharacterized protein n=1 Tax=Eptatretus burgeri TaxID=7764 RepID=A0A8C4QN55_EPTBU
MQSMRALPLLCCCLLYLIQVRAARRLSTVYPEMINKSLHYYFVPDGEFDPESEDFHRCQFEFDLSGRRLKPMGLSNRHQWGQTMARIRNHLQVSASLLAALGVQAQQDTEGLALGYESFLQNELSELRPVFSMAKVGLDELEAQLYIHATVSPEQSIMVLGLLGLVERAHSMDDTMSGVHTTTATTTSNMLAVESMAIVNEARLANMLRDYVENWHVTQH